MSFNHCIRAVVVVSEVCPGLMNVEIQVLLHWKLAYEISHGKMAHTKFPGDLDMHPKPQGSGTLIQPKACKFQYT